MGSLVSQEIVPLFEKLKWLLWLLKIHIPLYDVKEFVCLSVRPSVTIFEPNYLWTGKTEQV